MTTFAELADRLPEPMTPRQVAKEVLAHQKAIGRRWCMNCGEDMPVSTHGRRQFCSKTCADEYAAADRAEYFAQHKAADPWGRRATGEHDENRHGAIPVARTSAAVMAWVDGLG